MLPRAKKSYGQNWLVDETVVAKIINAAEISVGDQVLEIGPGTGVLTQALVSARARVTALEADADLIAPLRLRFGDRIKLVHTDAFSFDLSSCYLPSTSYYLISNLPYNLTSDILRHFLTIRLKPKRMVLMLQREVVDRITAKPPKMSLLSVVCQLYARCEKIANVPACAFRPIPKVDSAIVRLDILKEGSDLERENIIKTAKVGFSSPRKQLYGNLVRGLGVSTQTAKDALVSIGLNPKIRAESLTLENWSTLAHSLK